VEAQEIQLTPQKFPQQLAAFAKADTLAQMANDQNHMGHFDMRAAPG